MKLVSFLRDENEQLGVIINDQLVDIEDLHPDLPVTMNMFLYYWDDAYAAAQAGVLLLEEGSRNISPILSDEPLLSPLPFPASYRIFEKNLEQFRFANHQSIRGAGSIALETGKYSNIRSLPQLGLVIAKAGKDIPVSGAEEYIAGFLLLNTLTGEDASGMSRQDFCTVAGPWLLGINQAEPIFSDHDENVAFQLSLDQAVLASSAEKLSLPECFECIAKASYGLSLHPGDIISIPLFQETINWPANGLENGSLLSLTHPSLGKLEFALSIEEAV